MLASFLLSRTSASFQRGYRDGYEARSLDSAAFASDAEYRDGFKAGAQDRSGDRR